MIRKNTVRQTFLPFALPDTDDDEIKEIAEAVRSGWITTGLQKTVDLFKVTKTLTQAPDRRRNRDIHRLLHRDQINRAARQEYRCVL